MGKPSKLTTPFYAYLKKNAVGSTTMVIKYNGDKRVKGTYASFNDLYVTRFWKM